MFKFLVIIFVIFGGIYLLFKYISKKRIGTFFKNAGIDPEQFKQQKGNFNNNYKKENDEVLYQKDNTVILKGEAGKNKK